MREVVMAEHYSPNDTHTFYKGAQYDVRDENLRSFNLWKDRDHNDWFNIPKEFIVGYENKSVEEYGGDAWSMIADRTGIDRHTVKTFFFKYWHEIPIPTICKEHKIRCQDIAHMIAVFNEWADAQDPGER